MMVFVMVGWLLLVVVISSEMQRASPYITLPGVPTATDEDILVVDTVAATTGVIGIVVFQLPNCPIVYPSDPSKRWLFSCFVL